MKTIRIVTHSDDTIDIDGLTEGNGMDTNARGGVYGTVEIMDRAHSRGATIECHYTSDLSTTIGVGVWTALVRRPDEGVGLLPVRINALDFPGRIAEVSPALDAVSRTVLAKIDRPAGAAVRSLRPHEKAKTSTVGVKGRGKN